MPRYRRLAPPGSVQHLITRFAQQEFRLTTRRERDEYVARFGAAIGTTDWHALGYGTMDNHFHAGAVAGTEPPGRFMSRVNTGMAIWLNTREQRLGPVFAGRFRNVTIDPERVAYLLAYMHNNPRRAGLVDDPADTDRTSHRAYLGLVPAPTWLDVELGLSLAGFDSSPRGRAAFHEFVLSRANDGRDPEISGHTADDMRARLRRSLGAPVEASSPAVAATGRSSLVAHPRPLTPIRPRWDGPLGILLGEIADSTGVPIDRLQSTDRSRPVVAARRLALVVGSRHLGRPQVEVAASLGLSASGAHRLLRSEAAERMNAAAAMIADRIRRG